jgi:hypothetical protein
MSSDCCRALAGVRAFWRGRRLLRLAACASLLLVGSASTSLFVATALADDLPRSPAQSAQTDPDGTSPAPVAPSENTTTPEVTPDAVEAPTTTTDGFETSTDISATASDTEVTTSSSTDASSTDTSTTATEPTAGTTTDGTGAATDNAASSCTMDGVGVVGATTAPPDNTPQRNTELTRLATPLVRPSLKPTTQTQRTPVSRSKLPGTLPSPITQRCRAMRPQAMRS